MTPYSITSKLQCMRYISIQQNHSEANPPRPDRKESISRVSNQNGISVQRYIVDMYHSGKEPSNYTP